LKWRKKPIRNEPTSTEEKMNRFGLMLSMLCALLLPGLILAQDTTLAVTADGNVGIGIANPAARLHVVGRVGSTLIIEAAQPFLVLNTNTTWQSGISLQANGVRLWSIFSDIGGYSRNNLSFYDVRAGAIRLFIREDGNVGIGTGDPAEKLVVAGNAHVSGKITSGIARVSLPIAYGVINRDGSVIEATSNVSSTWNATDQRYEISITGESYFIRTYVTAVTVLGGSSPFLATTSSVSGKLLVYVFDLAGNKTQERFHFVVFKP